MLGNLIAAAGSLAGGLFGQRSQEKTAERNIELQKQFAQQGIQWKVADAKAAGVHPLFALGANTHSFAPVSVGSPLADGLARAGQDIGRAVHSTSDANTRATSLTAAASKLSLENQALQNQLLSAQIKKLQVESNPAPPTMDTKYLIPGQGETALPSVPGTIIDKGQVRKGIDPSAPYKESGAIADVGLARNRYGLYPVPGEDIKQRIEDNLPHEIMHFVRNNLVPAFGMNRIESDKLPPLPQGHVWSYSPIWGYYQRRLYSPRHRERFEGR